ncbi:MAG: DUF87 domain-containing protein, partial [Patescibacteria group bacterium]
MDFGQTQNALIPDWLWPILFSAIGIFVLAFFLWLALYLVRRILNSPKFISAPFQKKIYVLTVPKQTDDEENKKSVKDILAAVENLYVSLGGITPQKGFKAWLLGRHDHWSFEIVVGFDSLIAFYLAVPDYLENYIKQQFLSQYPHCQIEEAEDYNIFAPQGFAVVGHLKLIKDKIFPILTYKQAESDPMAGVLSVLSKLPEGQTAAIQMIMRTADPVWRKKSVRIASEAHQGKSLKQALASSGSGGISKAFGNPSEWFYSQKKNEPKEQYRLSAMEEQVVKSIEEKASKAGFEANIRLVAFAPLESQAKDILRQMANSFAQYSNYEYANGFKAVIKGAGKKLITDFIYRYYDEKLGLVLNSEEMTSLWHLPLPVAEVPKIKWLMAKKLQPPVNLPSDGLVLGESIYRGQSHIVRLKEKDRQRHMYTIGMTGTGKSWLMANLAIQDILNGKGVCVVDPHGSLIDDILPHIPKERAEDVIILDPADIERPLGMNMLEAKTPYEMDFAAQEMINIFYKLLPDPAMGGPMFEHYMRNALLALMADTENPGTLVELPRIFTDDAYRKEKLKHVKDILVKDFWEREYAASQKGSTAADMLSYVISKTGRFVENEMMRNIIGQPKSGFNFRQVMDQEKILLINLSKGRVGETNSSLLGLIAVSKLQMAAMARADMPESERKDFYLYIDEFQN